MSMPNDPYHQGYPPNQGYPPPATYPVPGGYPPGAYGQYRYEPAQDPDSALGIVGLVLSVIGLGPIGLVVSWIALNNSKRRGYRNTLALIGAIVGGAITALYVLLVVGYLLFFVVFVGLFISAASSGLV